MGSCGSGSHKNNNLKKTAMNCLELKIIQGITKLRYYHAHGTDLTHNIYTTPPLFLQNHTLLVAIHFLDRELFSQLLKFLSL